MLHRTLCDTVGQASLKIAVIDWVTRRNYGITSIGITVFLSQSTFSPDDRLRKKFNTQLRHIDFGNRLGKLRQPCIRSSVLFLVPLPLMDDDLLEKMMPNSDWKRANALPLPNPFIVLFLTYHVLKISCQSHPVRDQRHYYLKPWSSKQLNPVRHRSHATPTTV